MMKPKNKKVEEVEAKPTRNPKSYMIKEVENDAAIAFYYGFTPIKSPSVNKEDETKVKGIVEEKNKTRDKNDESLLYPKVIEKNAILRTYLELEMQNSMPPAMIYYKRPMQNGTPKRNPKNQECGLEMLGMGRSVAEAIMIRTCISILEDEGYKDLTVEINSIGDKESLNKFEKELTNYFRKNLHMLNAAQRQAFRKDVFEILKCKEENCSSFVENAPQAMSSLSDASRTHFKEVLEYMDAMGINYKIDNSLMANKDFCGQTVFAIRGGLTDKKDSNTLLAFGSRYNSLAKKIGFKKELPAIGAIMSYKKSFKNKKTYNLEKLPKPKFCFVQLGEEARYKSLGVLETLRKRKIPVAHNLMRDKITSQLAFAESLKVPYILLMGQKEALEKSVMVRHTATRAQTSVKIDELEDYLKKLK